MARVPEFSLYRLLRFQRTPFSVLDVAEEFEPSLCIRRFEY